MRIPPLLSMDPLNFDTWIETQLTGAILNAKNTWNVVQLKTNNGCEKKKKKRRMCCIKLSTFRVLQIVIIYERLEMKHKCVKNIYIYMKTRKKFSLSIIIEIDINIFVRKVKKDKEDTLFLLLILKRN